MATSENITDNPQTKDKMRQDIQQMLTEVGLSVEYWMPKFQEQVRVTSAQALQFLKENDLQKLKSQAQHPWETRALEKLLELSQSNSHPESQESPVETMKKRQKQAEEALQELRELQSEGKQRQEEAVRRKEAELKQAMDIPEQYWPKPGILLKDVIENVQKHLSHMEHTLTHRQTLPDREVIQWASGGLALQGIYKTSHQKDLIEKREELLSVPKEFSLLGPEQGTRMETKEFTSSQAEDLFTQTIEKLGFGVTMSAKGEGWGFNLEGGMDQSKHSESKKTNQSHSERSYFCSCKFSYVPLATCHFPMDQLQLSKAALQELKTTEELLDHSADQNRHDSLRRGIEKFFHRFGSHANKGPFHLGGIYCWKANSQGFRSEQLADVRQQAAEALDIYIRGSYSGFGVKVAAGMNKSDSYSKSTSENTALQNFQTQVQLSVAHIGGPPEADGIVQWKAGLVASNQTWSIIDQGHQLVPIWDIILSSHRNDFRDPLRVANCMKDHYTALTGLPAQILDGEELLSAGKEARLFLDEVKSWEVSDPEEQLKKLMYFMHMLSKKIKDYDIWTNMCLTDIGLQNFLINTVEFCKNSSIHRTKFIKSQLHSLLDPHVHKVTNFPQAHSIMQWILQSEAEEEQVRISQFIDFIKSLKETQKHLMEVNLKTPEAAEEAQRKSTHQVTKSLSSFLNHLQETEQPDLQLLVLSIAAGAGFQWERKIFQKLLACDELDFLLDEMQSVHHKYQELKNICDSRAQAFLVLTALTATVGITAISSEEKTHRLKLMKEHMGELLSTEVLHLVTKFTADEDWENLEKNLKILSEGKYEDTISPLPMDEVKKQFLSLYHEKKKAFKTRENENVKEEVIESGPFLDLLQRLGLEHYYPKRMSRADFHLIYKTSVYDTQPTSERELPFYFLQKLLMLDYGVRYLVFRDDGDKENQVYTGSSPQENEALDPYEDLFEDRDELTNPSSSTPQPHIHPMDIQMAIFHCADNFARQYIVGKLSTCQFALPLLVPTPNTSQIEFSLWPFRQIRRSWQEASKSPQLKSSSHSSQQMCCIPAPIVSFIRVGHGLSASKSQIMNSLVSKRKHDVFFHRHCKGSSKDCLLMGGVVELCWFCPGGEDEDRFEKCVTFINLHGDAQEHKQQLTFLQEVSSLIIILMSASDENKENQEVVRTLWRASQPVICLLDDKEKIMAKNTGRRVKIGIRNRNEAELTEELTAAIKHLLELSDTALTLEECSLIAHKQGFLIDEDQIDCKEAKEKAQTIMALLAELELPKIKESLLPLQGKMWHLWCKKDKELYHLREKGNRSIEQHKSDIEREKRLIRSQQLDEAFPLNDLMRSVLEILQEDSETHSKLYFLQWLGVFLDNLTSGHLENLHEKLRSLWINIQKEKQKTQVSKYLKLWESQIETVSREISDCTLGIEHLLRESAQIYEALEDNYSQIDPLFLSLPKIAADLLISGVPIELMDGDASYVPLKWVAAVFDKVYEKLGDKRLFVLSVLGLQSSGKSTLLNALFGLQFTVSAGRCTRGAYMQLLKVEETVTKELGIDFVLIVDTEGLRAPELNNKSQNWDNELATFVIGLGNLTLINIFGENPSEMQDILQIAVQAFLRMKQVKISPSCLFVHQNVGEVTAKDKTMEGRRRLEQRLDEMTALAAIQEECSHVTRFSDVIKFDINTQVYYFAHLWDGNPPMAPPNPRYSHNVQELKSRILLTAQQESRRSIMKISDVKFRVNDLWKALVSENFIFSFRNTQEIMAMSKIETMYNQWSWELRSYMRDLQTQLNNQVQNGKILTLPTNILEIPVNKKYETIKKKLEKFFKEDQDSEILVQWKANFEHKLLILKEKLLSDTRNKVIELINLRKGQERLDQEKEHYKSELLEKSHKLALKLKGKELSDEKLKEKFNELWTGWVYQVSSSVPKVIEPDIDVDFENTFLEHFKKEKNIGEKLKKNSGEKFQIDFDKHVQMKRRICVFSKNLEVCHKESIKMITDQIFSEFEKTMKNIGRQKRDYHVNDFHEILRIIEKEVNSLSPKEDFTFTSKYNIDLSLCLFQRASKSFKEMHREFKRANDPVNYLESKKDDFFMSFKISCQGASSITSFVDFLWNKLIPAISDTIRGKMIIKIAGDMRATCPAFNGNRANLEKHILISLAEEENFENYWQYIHYPKSFFMSYIGNHIRRYCSDQRNEKVKTVLKMSLDDVKNTILTAIHQSTAVAKEESSTASWWLDLFCDHLGDNVIFPRRDLKSIEHQEITDIKFLKETMSAALIPAMKKVEENCSSMPIGEIVPEIEKILSEHLCGCWNQCPLCKAICTNTIPTHDGDHSVPFHRPQAIIGWKWLFTNDFAIECCSTCVASDWYFKLSDGRTFPYKNYRLAGGNYATWSITPDTSTQPYWKWFVCHFRSQLEERYMHTFTNKGTIPESWARITKKDVLDNLKK